jgi:hypothetical protein
MMTLQQVIFPEQNICTETALYFHLDGIAGYRESTGSIHLEPGAVALFDTYFNALSIGKWHESCTLDGLFLGLEGQGRVELKVFHAIPERSWELLCCEVISFARGAEHLADLSHYWRNATRGVIYFEVKALARSVIEKSRFMTRAPQQPLPKLAISITTFKREAEVEQTVRRLVDFLDGYEHGDLVHVQVIDNGSSAVIPKNARVSYIANRNLGGAGGFARGLIEAEASGHTHVLFMDDDASFHMENLRRTHAFLALARDPATALAGAMINNTHKWAMWENGAIFDRSCRPQFCGLDLRHRQSVLDLEYISARESRPNFYGGWWYFAFPIAHVTHHPFPFFVRGDDVSFSLANGFRIVTLNGLVSFQDDFTEKESPQTLYLDLRGHLLHHMQFDAIDIGRVGCAKVALRFIMRSLVRFHYETAEAQLLSWQDVMRGPGFFETNADMAERRSAVKALTKNETWVPVAGLDLAERRRYTRRGGRWEKLFFYTLNGHFLPFFTRWGDRVVLPVGERGMMHPIWGAARITYLNMTRDKGYTVTQDKLRFFRFGLRLTATTIRFLRRYDELKRAYRGDYPKMTSRSFWSRLFQPKAAAPAPSPSPAAAPAAASGKT